PAARAAVRSTEEQEAERQHPGQGQDVAAHKPPDPRSRRGFHLPHRVQGVLELNHDADGRKDEGANAYCGRDHAFARPVGALEHGFDGVGAGVADEPLQRAEIWPCTASAPKTRPAIAIAMRIKGPSENTE